METHRIKEGVPPPPHHSNGPHQWPEQEAENKASVTNGFFLPSLRPDVGTNVLYT